MRVSPAPQREEMAAINDRRSRQQALRLAIRDEK
jgi:hypothetical protein